jgi:hypothetical protein
VNEWTPDFTLRNYSGRDPEFIAILRKLRPDWFPPDTSNGKKNALLTMPRGSKKPSIRTILGSALFRYTNNKESYDPTFDAAIRKAQPDWFLGKKYKNFVCLNKETLLKLPPGSPRPDSRTKLGSALNAYARNKSLHHEFFVRIKARQPQWFYGEAFRKTSDSCKEELLALVPGCPRPKARTRLGLRLVSYTCKSHRCYDTSFSELILQRQPAWFVKSSIVNKRELLAFESGHPKPHYSTRMGRALQSYISKACYDLSFDKSIRERHPEWFNDSATENKDQLLGITRGAPKPHYSTKPGRAFTRYVNRSQTTYDPEFVIKIRERQPGWFTRGSRHE